MDISIVIVSHNHPDTLKKTLDSIYTREHNFNFEAFVVDNASTEKNVEIIRKKFPQVNLIHNRKNYGFAKASNQGIRKCRGKFILLLNPDIEVLDNSLSKLLEFMRNNPQAAAAGGKLLYPDGSLQMSCRNFYTLSTILLRRTFLKKVFPEHKLINRHLMSGWHHEHFRIVDWIIGACIIIRKEVIEKIGLLDERFFMYFEDVDLCYRLKKAGLKIYYVPEAKFIHFHRRDSADGLFNRKLFWHIESMLKFYWKHHF